MTSGIQYSTDYFGHKQNWIDSILNLPIEMRSYKKFQYEDGNAHLVSAILKNATGMNIREYANKNLFSKIGIEEIEEDDCKFYYARGTGEQYIFIVPKLNMVFVFLGDENSSSKSNIALFWKVHLLNKLLPKFS